MKKSILTLVIAIFAVVAFGSTSSFEKEMKQNLETLRADKESIDYKKLGDSFEKIAMDNTNRFEPLYYSAYSYILSSWQVSDAAKKVEVLAKAKKQIDKAIEIDPNNDELLALDAFYYQAMIMTNPQKYGQSNSIKASELLQKAKSINSSNPRVVFLLAENTYYTPEQYGGGKKAALPLFKKAAKLFKHQNTDNYLLPTWGEETNAAMIKQCKK